MTKETEKQMQGNSIELAQEHTPARPQEYPVAVLPSQMIMQAVQQGAGIDQLNQLMDLQERYEANEARKLFNLAMSKFRSEDIHVAKNAVVDFTYNGKRTFYKHARLSDMVKAASSVMSKYGLSHNWSCEQHDMNITVTCTLRHEAGHSESVSMTEMPDSSGGKNRVQALGSTAKYLQRYTFEMITGIAVADDLENEESLGTEQPDHSAGQTTGQADFSDKNTATNTAKKQQLVTVTNDQAIEIQQLVDQTGTDESSFFEYITKKEGRVIELYGEIPANAFNPIKAMLTKKLNQTTEQNPFNNGEQ